MRPELASALIGLAGAVVGGGITSFTTWVISRSEHGRFARERTWDIKREVYTKLLGSLVKAVRWAENIDRRYQDDPHRYDASNDVKKHGAHFVGFMQEAQDAFASNRLMISATIVKRFVQLQSELEDVSDNPNLAPPEQAELAHKALKAGFDALSDMAKKEIE